MKEDLLFVDEVHTRGDEGVVFVNTDAEWAISTTWWTRAQVAAVFPPPPMIEPEKG